MTTVTETRADEGAMAESSTNAIEMDGVSVRFGRRYAVRDLSLHVPRGAIYGLIGPSGAGKTTVLRVLATLRPPDTGTVRIGGLDSAADPTVVHALIGYLPDVVGFYDALTAREYLTFCGALFGLPAQQCRRAAGELLELFGLTDVQDHPIRGLSRGMRQQLGVARCLIHDPDILLLDDPAAGMDPQSRLNLRDILTELGRLGKTVLVSSHLLAELEDVCTHVGFMRDGRLLADGEMADIANGQEPLEAVYRRLMEQPIPGGEQP